MTLLDALQGGVELILTLTGNDRRRIIIHMNKDARFAMRLEPDLKDRLQALADRDRRSLSNFVEQILRDYVDRAARREARA
jgi:hypothetical protein